MADGRRLWLRLRGMSSGSCLFDTFVARPAEADLGAGQTMAGPMCFLMKHI